MVHILFDFEVNPKIKHPYPKEFYDRIKAFYNDCYAPMATLTDIVVAAGGFPVMMLVIFKDGIRSIPVGMPDFVASALHHTVWQDKFDVIKIELDEIWEKS